MCIARRKGNREVDIAIEVIASALQVSQYTIRLHGYIGGGCIRE